MVCRWSLIKIDTSYSDVADLLGKSKSTIYRNVRRWSTKPENNITKAAALGAAQRQLGEELSETRNMNKSWQEVKMLARNRVRWRNFVDALCSAME